MVSFQNFTKELINQGIERIIVEKLVAEYKTVKAAAFHQRDCEKVLLHSAKLAEIILALIKNQVTGEAEDVNNLHFNRLFEEVIKYSKSSAKNVILTLAIPRVAQSIYTIRSKKNVAHVKTIDPSFIDSSYCVCACNWILAELVMLFYVSDPKEASGLINSILEKRTPLVEEFEDESVVILKKGLLVSEEFLVYLYHIYPNRTTDEDLVKAIRYKNPTYARKVLEKLNTDKLIHLNDNGSRLTELGIRFVEDGIFTKKE